MPRKQLRLNLTGYIKMLLASGEIGPWWGRFSFLFAWILVQGFVILPSLFPVYDTTLAKLKKQTTGSKALQDTIKTDIITVLQHVKLFWVALVAIAIGIFGMLTCMFKWRRNYSWGLANVIIPGLFAASTGLVSTVANIVETEKGFTHMTFPNKLALYLTGGATGTFFILWVFYDKVLVRNMKNKHTKKAGYYGVGENGAGGLVVGDEMIER